MTKGFLNKIWNWLEHNRFTVICPAVGIVIWVTDIGCTPETKSPIEPDRMVDARELAVDYQIWQAEQKIIEAKFEAAGEHIAEQIEVNEKFSQFLLTLASGSVADWGGLLQLILAGGFLGIVGDNIRKNGVIGGLKRAVVKP